MIRISNKNFKKLIMKSLSSEFLRQRIHPWFIFKTYKTRNTQTGSQNSCSSPLYFSSILKYGITLECSLYEAMRINNFAPMEQWIAVDRVRSLVLFSKLWRPFAYKSSLPTTRCFFLFCIFATALAKERLHNGDDRYSNNTL